jgi:hypothetical protein
MGINALKYQADRRQTGVLGLPCFRGPICQELDLKKEQKKKEDAFTLH